MTPQANRKEFDLEDFLQFKPGASNPGMRRSSRRRCADIAIETMITDPSIPYLGWHMNKEDMTKFVGTLNNAVTACFDKPTAKTPFRIRSSAQYNDNGTSTVVLYRIQGLFTKSERTLINIEVIIKQMSPHLAKCPGFILQT